MSQDKAFVRKMVIWSKGELSKRLKMDLCNMVTEDGHLFAGFEEDEVGIIESVGHHAYHDGLADLFELTPEQLAKQDAFDGLVWSWWPSDDGHHIQIATVPEFMAVATSTGHAMVVYLGEAHHYKVSSEVEGGELRLAKAKAFAERTYERMRPRKPAMRRLPDEASEAQRKRGQELVAAVGAAAFVLTHNGIQVVAGDLTAWEDESQLSPHYYVKKNVLGFIAQVRELYELYKQGDQEAIEAATKYSYNLQWMMEGHLVHISHYYGEVHVLRVH